MFIAVHWDICNSSFRLKHSLVMMLLKCRVGSFGQCTWFIWGFLEQPILILHPICECGWSIVLSLSSVTGIHWHVCLARHRERKTREVWHALKDRCSSQTSPKMSTSLPLGSEEGVGAVVKHTRDTFPCHILWNLLIAESNYSQL